MKLVAVVLVLCVLSACECAKSTTSPTVTESSTGQDVTSEMTSKGATSTERPTTKPTTTKPETTKGATSTAKPTTKPPTTKPETTEPPTTHSTKQTTTAPHTTGKHTTAEVTTEKPQTTAKPPSEPPLFYVRDSKDNNTCILLQLDATFNISYESTKNKTKYKVVHLDKAMAEGNCSYVTAGGSVVAQLITIPIDSIGGSITWLFGQGKDYNLGSGEYAVVQQTLMFSFKHFEKPKLNGSVTVENKTNLYTAYTGNAYNCTHQAATMYKKENVTTVVMTTKRLTTQAFRTKKINLEFSGKIQVCAADQVTSNLVPIAVGAALAGLVVIVLIAYLIGRRRNKKGYESV